MGDAALLEFGDAAKYLRMTQLELLELQTQSKVSDGKKYVWVTKTDTAYEKAVIDEIVDGTAHCTRLVDQKKMKMSEEEAEESRVKDL